jgi:RND family efflux transporter MFP subunit
MIISKKPTDISLLFSRPFSGSLISALLLCLALLCLTLSSCNGTDDNEISNKREKQPLHNVEVATVEKRPVYLQQTVSGTLEAVTKIRLYNEESGRITELPYHEGDFVKKGTLLAQLDNAILKTDVAKATASREQAKVDLSRVTKLLPKKVATEDEVARAKTVLDLAIAEEKRQLIRLQQTSIRAPIDGVISERLYEPGDLLAPQSHMLTIIDPSTLQLDTSIAERWIPLIQRDQPVKLSIDALGDTKFAARIMRIHPTVNASTHKGIIELVLNPVPEGAREGQFARAEIDLKATERLVIPVQTILYEPEGAYVYRIIDDDNGDSIAEKVFFDQGLQFGTVTEVLSKLKIGDKIVSRGHLGLRNGKKVVIAGDHAVSTAEPQAAAVKPE